MMKKWYYCDRSCRDPPGRSTVGLKVRGWGSGGRGEEEEINELKISYFQLKAFFSLTPIFVSRLYSTKKPSFSHQKI
jgi:hypothetical protein